MLAVMLFVDMHRYGAGLAIIALRTSTWASAIIAAGTTEDEKNINNHILKGHHIKSKTIKMLC